MCSCAPPRPPTHTGVGKGEIEHISNTSIGEHPKTKLLRPNTMGIVKKKGGGGSKSHTNNRTQTQVKQ